MVLELLKKSKKRKLIVTENLNLNMDGEAVSEMD